MSYIAFSIINILIYLFTSHYLILLSIFNAILLIFISKYILDNQKELPVLSNMPITKWFNCFLIVPIILYLPYSLHILITSLKIDFGLVTILSYLFSCFGALYLYLQFNDHEKRTIELLITINLLLVGMFLITNTITFSYIMSYVLLIGMMLLIVKSDTKSLLKWLLLFLIINQRVQYVSYFMTENIILNSLNAGIGMNYALDIYIIIYFIYLNYSKSFVILIENKFNKVIKILLFNIILIFGFFSFEVIIRITNESIRISTNLIMKALMINSQYPLFDLSKIILLSEFILLGFICYYLIKKLYYSSIDTILIIMGSLAYIIYL